MNDNNILATLCNLDKNLGSHDSTTVFTPLCKNMNVRELSSALKHVTAIQYIGGVEGHAGDSWHFIMEDDVLIDQMDVLLNICKDAPKDADVLFFGIPSDREPPKKGDHRFDKLESTVMLPCCDCYAIRHNTAKILSLSVLPIRFCMNIHLSWLITKGEISTYVTTPNLSADGSKVGAFVGTVGGHSPLIFNKQYMQLANNLTLDLDSFDRTMKAMPFGKHPEVRHLFAKKLDEVGRYKDARHEYSTIFDLIALGDGVLGQDSEFMKSYLNSHKYDQSIVSA